MLLATAPTSLALYGFTEMCNNATLTVYSGTAPATPETALSGNTQLVQYTFASTAFSAVSTSGGYDQQTASFVSQTATPTNTGVATFARINFVPAAWTAGHAYNRGDVVSAGTNYYVCIVSGTAAASGGPTGTNQGQLDNTTAWNYIGPTSNGTTLCQVTVGTTNADLTLSNTNVQSGVTVTIQSLVFQIPVS